jgi:hypothetical protein
LRRNRVDVYRLEDIVGDRLAECNESLQFGALISLVIAKMKKVSGGPSALAGCSGGRYWRRRRTPWDGVVRTIRFELADKIAEVLVFFAERHRQMHVGRVPPWVVVTPGALAPK